MLGYFWLILFFLVEYIRPTSYLPGLLPLHLNLVIPILAVISAAFQPTPKEPAGTPRDLNLGLMIAFMVLLVISRFTAFMGFAAEMILETVAGYVAIYWVISRTVSSQARLKGIFFVLVMVHNIIMILSPEMLIDPTSRIHTITSGFFLGDGNDFALSLVIALPFGLFLIFDAKSVVRRVFLIAAVLFLIVGIIASQSRGATIALACVGLYYWFKSGRSLAMAFIVAAALAVIFVVAPSSYFDRMNTITNPTDGSAQGRIQSWKLAWNLALQNPILGIGAGNTPYMGKQNAHSVYFMVLGELGFPGFFVLLTLIIGNLRANRQLLRSCRAGPDYQRQRQLLASLSASLIAFAAAGAFLSAAYYPHAYVLAGLLTAGRRIVRAQAANAEHLVESPAASEISYHWALAPSSKRVL